MRLLLLSETFIKPRTRFVKSARSPWTDTPGGSRGASARAPAFRTDHAASSAADGGFQLKQPVLRFELTYCAVQMQKSARLAKAYVPIRNGRGGVWFWMVFWSQTLSRSDRVRNLRSVFRILTHETARSCFLCAKGMHTHQRRCCLALPCSLLGQFLF